MADDRRALEAVHATARVLAGAADEASAYPQLLAGIGAALGCERGVAWSAPDEDPTDLRVVARWPQDDGGEPGAPAAVVAVAYAGQPPGRLEPAGEADAAPEATLAAIGDLIGVFVNGCRVRQ